MNKEKYLRQVIKLRIYVDKLPNGIKEFVFEDLCNIFDPFSLVDELYDLKDGNSDYIADAIFGSGSIDVIYKRVISRLKEMGKIKE